MNVPLRRRASRGHRGVLGALALALVGTACSDGLDDGRPSLLASGKATEILGWFTAHPLACP